MTYYSQYYANIIGSDLVFEAGPEVWWIQPLRNIYSLVVYSTPEDSYSLFGFSAVKILSFRAHFNELLKIAI